MHRKKELLAHLFAASLVSAALFGCGGGGDNSTAGGTNGGGGTTLAGVAAEGRAIAKATVSIRDANGTTRSATTDANGNFSFSTASLAFPLMLKVTGSNGTYYTLLTSDDVGNKRVNISNFTSAIAQLALNASDNSALDDSYAKGGYAKISAATLSAADDAFKALLKNEFGTIAGVTDISPRFVSFTPSSDDQDGDEVDRMLNLFTPGRASGGGNSYISLNVVPEGIRDITVTSYDGTSDDLLTAGLGRAGIAGVAPFPATQTTFTAAELRKLAIYNNYRAVIDVSAASGFGALYGPNVDKNGGTSMGLIAGKEYIAYVDDGSGRKNVTVMVQIPSSFDKNKPCIVTGTSSGSRGIYGAIGTSGEWGLKNGCAVAYTDKGSGTGLHTFDDNTVNLRDGTRATADVAGKKSIFTAILNKLSLSAFNTQYPNRIAFKHAYSQQNPEKDWGRNTLDAVAFAFYALNQEYGGTPGNSGNNGQKQRVITPANTIVMASSISNGAGAALLAAEQDKLGLIDGVAANEPQIQPRTSTGYTVQQNGQAVKTQGKPLYDYSSYAAIYQPCIAGIAPRCDSLSDKGLLSSAVGSLAAQQAEARQRLMDYGWTADSDAFQDALAKATLTGTQGTAPGPFATFNATTNFLVTATYANAYGRFAPDEKVCGFTFASNDTAGNPVALSAAARAQSFAAQNGIIGNPIYEDSVGGAKAYTFGVSPSTGRADWSLDGMLCLRSLATGVDMVTGKPLTGDLANQSQRVRAGIAQVQAIGNLHGKPAIMVAGRSDHLIPPNNAERAYLGLNATIEGSASKLRYVEVTNANHFDTFSTYVPGNIVPLHVYLFRALDAVYANLQGNAGLPPSQVVRTTPRASNTETISNANLPAISPSPTAGNQISVSGTTVNVPN